MRYHQILQYLNESKSAPLYHAYKNINYAIEALTDNKIKATTDHRFWYDGNFKSEDDEDNYNNDFYYIRGISTTRSFPFAKAWGKIIFELDQVKLINKYKLIPINYGIYLSPEFIDNDYHKKEKEEFIAIKKFNNEKLITIKKSNFYLNNLNNYLTGIYIHKMYDNVEIFTNHEKFKGFY